MTCCAYVGGKKSGILFFIGEPVGVVRVSHKYLKPTLVEKNIPAAVSSVVALPDDDSVVFSQQTGLKAVRHARELSRVEDKSECFTVGGYKRRLNESNHRAQTRHRDNLRQEVVIYH